ncbi:MAG: MFS transporter [Eggerthellales bacterium]|nr:MFS transporter [Eggerthellales bacterium]
MKLVKDGLFLGKIEYCWVIAVACGLLQAFGMGLILNCSSLFYVYICDDMGFLRADISTYMTGYFIGTTIFTPIAGFLLSKLDIRKVMFVAILTLSGSVIAMSFYNEIYQWQISGFLVGSAGACIFVLPSASMIGNWFVKRRGTVYGIVMACSSISAAFMAPILNSIISASGWRTGYLFVGIAALIVIAPLCLVFRYKPSDIGCKPYGGDEIDEESNKRQKLGVKTKVAIGTVSFWCLFIFAGIASFNHGGVEQHIPGYMVQLGLGTAFGATVVSAQSAGSVADKFIMGWLNDKIGVKRTTIVELIVIMLGLAGFIFTREPILLIISAVAFGVQDSLMSVSLPLLIREIFGNKYYTQIHGLIRAGVGVLGTFSGVFVGWIYDTTGMFQPAFAILIALFIFDLFCVFAAYSFGKKIKWETPEGEIAINANK